MVGEVRMRNAPERGGLCFGLLLSLLAGLAAGCAPAKKKAAFPWQTATIVRPLIPAPETADLNEPDVPIETPPVPGEITGVLRLPARPHVNVSPSAPETTRPALPTIAPQLTPEESAAAQQDTSVSLSTAEKNVEGTRGKSLNASQADVLSKIRGFISDAREAARLGDWTRARNLAKKAQVLSEELARSL
jgi:hypothetical protein